MAEHAMENPNHTIVFDETVVLRSTHHYLACLHQDMIQNLQA